MTWREKLVGRANNPEIPKLTSNVTISGLVWGSNGSAGACDVDLGVIIGTQKEPCRRSVTWIFRALGVSFGVSFAGSSWASTLR